MNSVTRARFVAAALVLLCMHGPASAQDAGSPGLLVNARWLNAHLHDSHLVILTIGPGGAYSTGHIPGARAVAIPDITVRPPADSNVNMPAVPALLQTLEQKFGISSESQVVVASDSGWYSAGTRLMLTLQYAGLGQHSALLDGGVPAWRAGGYQLTTDLPAAPAPGHITAVPGAVELVVNHAYVTAHAHTPKTRLIDAREAACFNGGCPGHIAGAASIPMEALFDDAGMYKPKAELDALFRAAGVQAGDTVVAYCHNGFRSTAVVLAARVLGYPVRNYDGSFRDWTRRGLPIEGAH